ncbi:MAG: DUF1850 domain-containing protein [Gammaproteobacteria bacterium]|nr:DUF1850 domain-containing protein [Gammaproteobacteria bacterium]
MLFCPSTQASGTPYTLTISTAEQVLAEVPLAAEDQWCLHWNHSVTDEGVIDCYGIVEHKLTLIRAYQPDFAAGLGHYPGRGILTSAEGKGYWIEDINEPVPGNAYVLRVGSLAVDHRLILESHTVYLSRMAERQRVTIELSHD